MALATERTPQERMKVLEQALDALHFACVSVRDVVPEPQASGFVSVASELQTRLKTWRDEIAKENARGAQRKS